MAKKLTTPVVLPELRSRTILQLQALKRSHIATKTKAGSKRHYMIALICIFSLAMICPLPSDLITLLWFVGGILLATLFLVIGSRIEDKEEMYAKEIDAAADKIQEEIARKNVLTARLGQI